MTVAGLARRIVSWTDSMSAARASSRRGSRGPRRGRRATPGRAWRRFSAVKLSRDADPGSSEPVRTGGSVDPRRSGPPFVRNLVPEKRTGLQGRALEPGGDAGLLLDYFRISIAALAFWLARL